MVKKLMYGIHVGEFTQDMHKRDLERLGYVEIARKQTPFYRAAWKDIVFFAKAGKYKGCPFTLESYTDKNGNTWNGVRVYYAPKSLINNY